MIHRDHRKFYESASALGQIMHREGPCEVSGGDIDFYTHKCGIGLIRLNEHKQPGQAIGGAQRIFLMTLDECIKIAAENPSTRLKNLVRRAPFSRTDKLHEESGVFIIRGPLEPERDGHKKVDFSGPQIVEKVDGTKVLEPKTRKELYDWINGGPGWTPRKNKSRSWK